MNFEKGKISVIITCYNQEQYVAETITSIIAQSYLNWECFIVDDGSTDNSANIAKHFEQIDSRITCICQSNQGVSSARNAAFKIANGEFIQFLDGDDYILPDKFQKQVEFMNLHKVYDITYTNHKHFFESTGDFKQFSFKDLSDNPLHDVLFGWDRGVSLPIHSALLRRSIWGDQELPFDPEYKYRYEDWVFWVSVFLKKANICFLDIDAAIYRIHKQNFTGTESETLANFLKAVFKIKEMLPDPISEKYLNQNIFYALDKYAVQKIHEERQKPANKIAKKFIQPVLNCIPHRFLPN